MLVCSSTGVNVRYLLVYVAWTNVQVGVLGKGSALPAPLAAAECTVASPENVPNRLSATIIAQRSAAQYGQYSAPTYSTSGLPLAVRAAPLIVVGLAVTEPPPSPTESSALAGTLVTLDTTLARAAPVGPFGELSAAGLVFSLITTKATTIASTTTTLPDAMRIRRRCSARRAAARCAAIFSLRLVSTFVLLALPMLASSNPCVSQSAVRPHIRWFPCLRRRAGVFRRLGYRGPC